MTTEEKLAQLTEMMELDEGAIAEDTALASIPEWDSMAKLSLIALADDLCGKKLSGEQIRAFVTVQDILDFMG